MSYQRHPLEIGSLVFGLVFLGIVAAWGLFELGVVSGADTAWILPIVLIGAGALGVLLALTKPRRTEARQAAAAAYARQWAPAGYPEQPDTYTGYDEQTTTTEAPTEDTDTNTDAYADPSTDQSFETETQERRDD